MINVRGIIPLWAAWERGVAEQGKKKVSRSWFKEVDPPYRTGRGVRIGALHLGIMWPTRAKSELDVLGREVDATIDDISDWRPPASPRSEEEGTVEVRRCSQPYHCPCGCGAHSGCFFDEAEADHASD